MQFRHFAVTSIEGERHTVPLPFLSSCKCRV
nr:MAG TPA: hypothetical protein [Caudoviricetes sp.]